MLTHSQSIYKTIDNTQDNNMYVEVKITTDTQNDVSAGAFTWRQLV